MSFPSSPSNNQIAIVNNIRYSYSSAKGAWTRVAGSATSADQYARDTANTASSNTIVIQGVDTWQNTRIQAAFDKANTGGEYAIDNVARSTANTASNNITIIQGVNTTQNTYIQASFDKANTANITADAAFSRANTANISADAAFSKANSANILAQAAFSKANNALANTTGTFAGDLTVTGTLKSSYSVGDEGGEINLAIPATNTTISNHVVIDVYQNKLRIFEAGGTNRGAYLDLTSANTGVGSNLLAGGGGGGGSTLDQYARDTANSASSNTIIIQGVDVWQNTRMTAIEAYAQSAYSTANSGGGGGTTDQYARDVNVYQNTRITTVQTLAQAAFDAANTGGAGPVYQEKTYTYPSTISISTGTARWWSQGNTTITRARAQVITAPSGSPVTIVIKKNGTSAQTFSISSGDYSTQINTNITTVNGDYITIDLTSVGSASDLVISFLYTRTSV